MDGTKTRKLSMLMVSNTAALESLDDDVCAGLVSYTTDRQRRDVLDAERRGIHDAWTDLVEAEFRVMRIDPKRIAARQPWNENLKVTRIDV